MKLPASSETQTKYSYIAKLLLTCIRRWYNSDLILFIPFAIFLFFCVFRGEIYAPIRNSANIEVAKAPRENRIQKQKSITRAIHSGGMQFSIWVWMFFSVPCLAERQERLCFSVAFKPFNRSYRWRWKVKLAWSYSRSCLENLSRRKSLCVRMST